MSSLPLLALPGPSGFPWPDVLPYCAAVATALLGWFGARFTAHARLEATLLSASRALVVELQAMHARDTARISALELTVLERDGEIRGLKQMRDSLLRDKGRHESRGERL